MPKPVSKTEQDLREFEILDAIRADIDLAVKAYRRRMFDAASVPLIEEFRQTVKDTAVMPAIDAAYRDRIRAFVMNTRAALEAGDA